MNITVIICTYNNAKRLGITLESFCRLNLPENVSWELVAVNNNSSDHTKEVIKKFEDELPITYVFEPEQGLSRARNAGLEAAQGDLIVFTDDDVKPNPDWLVAYWQAYQERPEGWYFGGPIESEFEGEPPDADLKRIAMPSVVGLSYGLEAKPLTPQEFFIGANWACPLVYLRAVGNYDTRLGLNASSKKVSVGEETDLMQRLEAMGISGWYIPKTEIKHYVPAEKCKIDHILSRNVARANDVYENVSTHPTTVLGFPIGLYKKTLIEYIKWRANVFLGRQWKKEYIEYRIWRQLINVFYGKDK